MSLRTERSGGTLSNDAAESVNVFERHPRLWVAAGSGAALGGLGAEPNGWREEAMSTPAHQVEVLGPGCARCLETYRIVRSVLQQAQLDWPLQKVESTQRMVELGVLRTPAIAVDGKLVSSGRIPKPEEVRQLLGLG